MKKKINLHPTKVWNFLFSIYASHVVTCDYEDLAYVISQQFELTPEQWEAVLFNYEFIHETILS